jgi:prepilin peptidase CpaA
VTLPALAIVLGCFAWLGGSDGWTTALFDSLLGVAICAGPLLLASLRGAVGMGDVKLMAIAGAAAGWPSAIAVLVYVSVAGGVQALSWIAAARLRGLERPRHVPYGVAIAAGTVAAFFWADALFN